MPATFDLLCLRLIHQLVLRMLPGNYSGFLHVDNDNTAGWTGPKTVAPHTFPNSIDCTGNDSNRKPSLCLCDLISDMSAF